MSSESSTPDERELGARSDLPETLLIASVRRPHGVQGDLLCEVHSDVGDRFEVGARVELVTAAGARRTVEILKRRPHKAALILTLDGISTREAAEAHRGATLEITRASSPPPPEGQFYFYELVGCRCVDQAEGELGRVTAVVEDGGGLLLEVVDGERTLLLPFVEGFLEEVDVDRGVIRTKLPDGLVETCASTR